MTRFFLASLFLISAIGGSAQADVPKVVTDIAPVQALAARVMAGVDTPDQLVPSNASPHGHAMRPSEAGALEAADVVFWVGPELTPWMARAIDRLAGDAVAVALLHQGGGIEWEMRGEHDEGTTHDDGHHDEAHDEGHDHAEGSVDPHAWLDPENGKAWLHTIAETLAQADPANAATYRANADAGRAEIDAVSAEVAALLSPVTGVPYVVFHDAWQYFEARFGHFHSGAIALGDAADPGPRRVAEIRQRVRDLGVKCVFAEPQFNPSLVKTVTEGTGTRIAELDPIGLTLNPGPDMYPALILLVGSQMAGCLTQ